MTMYGFELDNALQLCCFVVHHEATPTTTRNPVTHHERATSKYYGPLCNTHP